MADLISPVPLQYEPRLTNRFFLEFPSELGIETWAVQTSGMPKMTIDPVEVPYINTKNYTAGKYSWGTIDIELLDPIGPSHSVKIMEWVRLCAESLTARMGYSAGFKKDLILKSLDPTGVPISKWVCEQCMITDVDFGSGDYGSAELMKIKFTVQPFRCILRY